MESRNKKVRVLMLGPGRSVKGGITTVVNSYFDYGLDQFTQLKYITTMKDGNKLYKLLVAVWGYIQFCFLVSRFDIVHIHMAAQASFSRKALFVKKAKKANRKIIIHQHSADFDKYYFEQCNDRQREQIRHIFSLADRVLVLSEEWQSFFGNNVCDKDKISILYNGVAVPDDKKTDYSDHNVLFLGRLGQRKGTYDLLKAIPEVLKSVPDAMFFLGGDGDVKECQALAREYAIGNRVSFLGWIDNAAKEAQFRKASIFVLPSYHEGMPMSVLEAMAHGLATVSSNAGGIPQIIDHGVNGLRVEAGDVSGLADALISLLSDEKAKKEMGAKGLATIQSKFDVCNNISYLNELYHTLS